MLKTGHYHLVGGCGVGMSALAQAMLDAGLSLSASDRRYGDAPGGPIAATLERAGVTWHPQDGSGVTRDTRAVVVSTAIEDDNPDVVTARRHSVPILHRSDVLSAMVEDGECVAIAGTSGKSTVTGMIGWILTAAGRDPTVINGAVVPAWQSSSRIGSVRLGRSGLWVVEADESDRSLLTLSPDYAVITNMSRDHFSLDETRQLFDAFRDRVTKRVIGPLVDDGGMAQRDLKVLPWGTTFRYADTCIEVPVPGAHNAENALHAVALCEALGVPVGDAAIWLKQFPGVARRLTVVARGRCTVVDDYAHNPAKLRAACRAMQDCHAQLIAVWRPHGYGPLRMMFDDLVEMFCEVMRPMDHLVMLPVYDAGGSADRSIQGDQLVDALVARGVHATYVEHVEPAIEIVARRVGEGSCVLTLGARDPGLPELARRLGERLNPRQA